VEAVDANALPRSPLRRHGGGFGIGCARKTLDFLGVPWDERVLEFDEHARTKMVRSPTYADVTQPGL
jgi:hypothetical protein